ncbi:MAG: hypothetical protein H6753_00190 [Candidatus Omnitrophica bacterium]|nr:hypothetical protein [Candidatus Omnitrophota bacterium]
MKLFLIGIGFLFILGCSAQTPLKNIIRDRQFSEYNSTLEQLESDYLQKKISYAQYLEQKNRVEEDYQQKIDTRRNLIQNQNAPSAVSEMLP